MNTVLEKIKKMGIVPVVVIENEKDAVPLADALCNGGLACAEVTFRTAAAGEAIRPMKEAHPEMLVGAGTVLTVEQVDRAVQAGAEFIVSPGFDPEIVDYCIEKKIPVLPGCITPSEAARAVRRGLSVIKFFPAEQARWWSGIYQGNGSTVYFLKFYANRRNQSGECKEISGIRSYFCLWRKLDGKRQTDHRRQV